jgi:hypothetical protein
MEEALLQRAQRHGAPFIGRETLAARLGADADVLDAVLRERAQDAAQETRAGLRLDQASMIYEALTSDRRVSVGVGPAGSGKTHTVAAGSRAWEGQRRAGDRVNRLPGRPQRALRGRYRQRVELDTVPSPNERAGGAAGGADPDRHRRGQHHLYDPPGRDRPPG